MKTIIAGGRYYHLTTLDFARIDAIHAYLTITLLVSGRASGADAGGEEWAKRNGVDVHPMPADWDDLTVPGAIIRRRRDGKLYNAAAGPMRNSQMAEFARGGVCILFPGNKGTEDMFRKAKAAGLRVYDYRGKNND